MQKISAMSRTGSGEIGLPDRSSVTQKSPTRSKKIQSVFGQFAAWKLANMTHEEEPWREAAQDNGEISHESLKTFFRTLMTHANDLESNKRLKNSTVAIPSTLR